MYDSPLPPDLAGVGEAITDEQLADEGGFDLDPIDNDEWAEWAMRRVVRAQVRIAEAEQRHGAWVGRIDDWLADVTAADRRIVSRLVAALENYARARRERDESCKTITLPSGTLYTTRPTSARVDIADEKAVLVWAAGLDEERRDSVIRTHPTVLVTGLRDVVRIVESEDGDRLVVDLNGEIVPGVTIVDPVVSSRVDTR